MAGGSKALWEKWAGKDEDLKQCRLQKTSHQLTSGGRPPPAKLSEEMGLHG